MQAETGAGTGSPHKGLVENLMEKAKEILPHQITGAGPAPASSTTSAAYPYASGANAVRILHNLCCIVQEASIFLPEIQHAAMHSLIAVMLETNTLKLA